MSFFLGGKTPIISPFSVGRIWGLFSPGISAHDIEDNNKKLIGGLALSIKYVFCRRHICLDFFREMGRVCVLGDVLEHVFYKLQFRTRKKW